MVSHNPARVLARPALALAATVVASLANALDVPYQQPPMALVASELLPKSLLAGDGYTIDEQVSNDGVQNTYTLKTHYGVLTETGTDELLARIQEVRSTMALQKLENTENVRFADVAE